MRLLYRVRFRRDHGWALSRMSEYLDGELPDGGRVRLERHMGDCPECERLLTELHAVVRSLGRLSAPAGGGGPGAAAVAAVVRGRLDEPPPS
jgi:anti-sigma factor RsiW